MVIIVNKNKHLCRRGKFNDEIVILVYTTIVLILIHPKDSQTGFCRKIIRIPQIFMKIFFIKTVKQLFETPLLTVIYSYFES